MVVQMVTKNKIQIISLFMLATFLLLGKTVQAEEIVVTNNGSGSNNEVNVSQSLNTTVQQSNTADITNEVSASANTGENTASGNTGGDTTIATGNIDSLTSINNAANTNTTTVDCCLAGGQVTTAGNGAGSDNTININQSSSTTITAYNTATITNSIRGYASTGNNTANFNNGDSRIYTGNIWVNEKIINGPINVNNISASVGGNGGNDVSVAGNGAWSDNKINLSNNFNLWVDVNNEANIYNKTLWNLITGNNDAKGNVGNVDIVTGDIVFKSVIVNEANVNKVTVDCCQKEEEKPAPPPTEKVTPQTTTVSDGRGGESKPSDGGRGGEVLAAAVGKILPVTGNNWLMYALLGNMLMLIMGAYLRLRSGRSPTFAFSA